MGQKNIYSMELIKDMFVRLDMTRFPLLSENKYWDEGIEDSWNALWSIERQLDNLSSPAAKE